MKFLVLILAVVPIYATGDVFGDLLGQEFHHAAIDHVREKRQAQSQIRSFQEAPPYVKQLLQAQNSQPPLIPLRAPTVPKLGPSQSVQPQVVPQSQISQYRPQLINPNNQQPQQPQQPQQLQQPNYKQIPVSPTRYKKPIYPQQPQYRPAPANYPQQAQPNYDNPQYAANLPAHLQQLVQYQRNLPNAPFGKL